jgi:hypothetical protein
MKKESALKRVAEVKILRESFAQLSPKARIHFLLEQPQTMLLVRSLSPLDLYATIQEVGIEDCLEILELVSPEQFQHFLDMDGWRHERLYVDGITRWLSALMAANPDRAVQQTQSLDIELFTLLMKIHTTVYDLEAGEDPPEEDIGLHSITPDQRYLIVYSGTETNEAMGLLLKQTIERLMGTKMLFVLRLCEAMRWDLPSSLEDAASRWRTGRLTDFGFFPFEEARLVFAPPPLKATTNSLSSTSSANNTLETIESFNTTPYLDTQVLFPHEILQDGEQVFTQALMQVPESIRIHIEQNLVPLANRVHSALRAETSDVDAIKNTVRRTTHTIGLGIAFKARGSLDYLAQPLLQHTLLELFQCGHQLTVKIQKQCKAAMRPQGPMPGQSLHRVDSPLREVCLGLLKPEPMYFCGLRDPSQNRYTFFSSLMDIAHTAKALREACWRSQFSLRFLGVSDAHLMACGYADLATQPSHSALCATWIAQSLLSSPTPFSFGKALLAPLTQQECITLQSIWNPQLQLPSNIEELIRTAATFMDSTETHDDHDSSIRIPWADHALQYTRLVWDAMHQEFDPLSSAWDTRYIHLLWIQSSTLKSSQVV